MDITQPIFKLQPPDFAWQQIQIIPNCDDDDDDDNNNNNSNDNNDDDNDDDDDEDVEDK